MAKLVNARTATLLCWLTVITLLGYGIFEFAIKRHHQREPIAFINKDGKTVISLKSLPLLKPGRIAPFSVGDFSCGKATICFYRPTGADPAYIDHEGKVLYAGRFSHIDHYSDGLAVFASRFADLPQKNGYIDTNGRVAIDPTFADANGFHEGLAFVRPKQRSGRWSCIDKSGTIVLRDVSDYAGRFVDGLRPISDLGKMGLIKIGGCVFA